ncbi:hypothetical protein HA402_002910 [Bradysia odoriphaga]|nr:hypothetical protein HA402_002910 [Bradysia odoriphaga]
MSQTNNADVITVEPKPTGFTSFPSAETADDERKKSVASDVGQIYWGHRAVILVLVVAAVMDVLEENVAEIVVIVVDVATCVAANYVS